jgi:plastocyanin
MRLNNLRPCRALGAAMVAVWISACGGGEKPAPPSAPSADAKRVDESQAGRLAGRVLIAGQPPQGQAVKMHSDPVCERAEGTAGAVDPVAVQDGGLDNVFVYVKDGLGNYYFDTPTEPMKIDQKGCRYLPTVFGVRVGQRVEFSNSDPTAHNVHAVGDANRGFNFTQRMAGMRDTRTFNAREVMVHVKCDIHSWMNAYAGVLDHPYFAVTSNGGRFELKNVPPGTYTFEAWHATLGTQAQQVTLGEKDTKELTFTFRAS